MGNAAVVWNITILDASGTEASVFNSGESGFVDVSVELDGVDLTSPATSYQAVVRLNNPSGISVDPAIETPGEDLHATADLFNFTSPDIVWGEFQLGGAVPSDSTNSLFRLPFLVTGTGPSSHSFSVLSQDSDGTNFTDWNGNQASSVFGLAATGSFTVTAVPEPGSVALYGLVCAGVAASRRRKSRKSKLKTA